MSHDLNPSEFKSGFVALLGPPNAGKSTLLNRLLGEKISITSQKPQTTRNRILGILNRENAQIIFMDTPGVHRASGSLNTRIVEVALSCLPDMDAAIVILDGASPDSHSEKILFNALKAQEKPIILAVNKVDSAEKSLLAQRIDLWSKMVNFQEIVPISARTGFQVDILIKALEKLLPSGPPFYPTDAITDVPERFIAAEMVREKIFRLTGEEIPYSTAVTIEDFSEDADRNLVSIQAVIHVERESQKGIIIGKNGDKLKQIGRAAREDIERMTGCRVFLKLFVRVQKNWTKDARAINRFGY